MYVIDWCLFTRFVKCWCGGADDCGVSFQGAGLEGVGEARGGMVGWRVGAEVRVAMFAGEKESGGWAMVNRQVKVMSCCMMFVTAKSK